MDDEHTVELAVLFFALLGAAVFGFALGTGLSVLADWIIRSMT